jgi:putative sterol carrier protein
MAEEIEEWCKEKSWIMEYLWKSETGEPKVVDLLGAFIVNVVLKSPEAIIIAGKMPPRVIHFNVSHPKRGREDCVLMITPIAIFDGRPEEEPDVVLDIDYYDLVAVLGGEKDVMDMVWDGSVTLSGNTVVGMDLKDIIDASVGKLGTERPSTWVIGVP